MRKSLVLPRKGPFQPRALRPGPLPAGLNKMLRWVHGVWQTDWQGSASVSASCSKIKESSLRGATWSPGPPRGSWNQEWKHQASCPLSRPLSPHQGLYNPAKPETLSGNVQVQGAATSLSTECLPGADPAPGLGCSGTALCSKCMCFCRLGPAVGHSATSRRTVHSLGAARRGLMTSGAPT